MTTDTDARPIPVERLTRLWPTANPSSWRWVSGQRLTGATPTGTVLVTIAPPWTGTEDMVGQLLPESATRDPQQVGQVWLWLLAHLAQRAQDRAGCATGRPTTGETGQCTWCGAGESDHDHAVDTYLGSLPTPITWVDVLDPARLWAAHVAR